MTRSTLTAGFALLLLAGPVSAQTCICLKCVFGNFRSFLPTSGSMKPILEPAQCAIFDLTVVPRDIPLGSIIVFRHPTLDVEFVKRLIATQGQTVQITGGALFIDGVEIPTVPAPPYVETMSQQGPQGSLPRCPIMVPIGQTCDIEQATETLGDQSYEILNLQDGGMTDNTGLFTVPEGHVFVMGDHRDNSTDSRIPTASRGIGFVPLENVIGVLDQIH